MRERGADVMKLNELEIVRGEIWANVWQTDRIVRIAPDSGDVVGELDLRGLDGGWDKANPDAVPNGIAYDSAHDPDLRHREDVAEALRDRRAEVTALTRREKPLPWPEGALARPEGALARPEKPFPRPEDALARPENPFPRPEDALS